MTEIPEQIFDKGTAENGVHYYSVKKGLFIEESLLAEADLGPDIQIRVFKGKIIIVPKTETCSHSGEEERRQAIFEFFEFVKNAPKGILDNPSEKHDEYLYGSQS